MVNRIIDGKVRDRRYPFNRLWRDRYTPYNRFWDKESLAKLVEDYFALEARKKGSS